MIILLKRITSVAVAGVMLTTALTGCALPPEERAAGAGNAGLPADGSDAATYIQDESTVGPETEKPSEPETTEPETTEPETTEPETTVTEPDVSGAAYGIDEDVWESLPDELRGQIVRYGKGEDFDLDYCFHECYFDRITIHVYPYFSEKKYDVLDFKEIEDCTAVDFLDDARGLDVKLGIIWSLKLSSNSPERVMEILQMLKKRPDIMDAYPPGIVYAHIDDDEE